MKLTMRLLSGCWLAFLLVLTVDSTRLRGRLRRSQVEADTRWLNITCKMFTMWEYKNGVPFYIEKDMQSWRYHTHHKCGDTLLINDTNVKQYIPDLPQQYFSFPDHGSKSDFIRYALLYHHGGMYMDTDFLVAKDMDDVLDKIQGNFDLVSYTNYDNECTGFSSNFLAGRQGSSFYKAVWEEQKRMVMESCADPFGAENRDKVCCDKKSCHVPWGGLGERVSHPIYDDWVKDKKPFRSFCFSEKSGESFNPDGLGTVLYAKYWAGSAEKWWKNVLRTKKPEDRIAYHLFNNAGFYDLYSDSALFDRDLAVGKLFRKALDGAIKEFPAMPWQGDDAVECASHGEMCVCSGKVYYGRRYKRVEGVETRDPIDFRGLTTFKNKVRDVSGSIVCNSQGFGGDAVQGGVEHACWCQAAHIKKRKSPLELGSAVVCAEDGEQCNCNGNVYYGRKYRSTDGQLSNEDFENLLSKSYRVRQVHGSMACKPWEFNGGAAGGDPQVKQPKHCLCQASKM